MVFSHWTRTKAITRTIIMGSTIICRALHTAPREITTQIPIEFCRLVICLVLGVAQCEYTKSDTNVMQVIQIRLRLFLDLMVSSHWQWPRPIPIKNGLQRIVWRCSHCTEIEDNTDSHWVQYTCHQSRSRSQSLPLLVWGNHKTFYFEHHTRSRPLGRCWCEWWNCDSLSMLKPCLHVPSKLPFFVPFQNGFSVFLLCCLHINY